MGVLRTWEGGRRLGALWALRAVGALGFLGNLDNLHHCGKTNIIFDLLHQSVNHHLLSFKKGKILMVIILELNFKQG